MDTKSTPIATYAISRKRPYLERGWTWWIVPKPFDLVSSLLYLGFLAATLYRLWLPTCSCNFFWGYVVAISCIIVALLAVDRVEYWYYGEEPPKRVAAVLLLLRIVLIETITWLDSFNFSPFLYFIIPFLVSVYFGNRLSYVLATMVWLAYVLKLSWFYHDWYMNANSVSHLIEYSIGLVFAAAMARAVNLEKASRARAERLLAQLKESHQQLQVYSEQVAELATTKERNRLARDIHDTLGHYLTVINVQLEKALAFRDKKPEEANQAISDAKRLASNALQDVRHSVSALRTTQNIFVFSPAVNELLNRIRNDHCAIELSIEGNEESFAGPVLMALYRVVQEGLTNVQKHAYASNVFVHIQFGEQMAKLSLADNGCGFDPTILQEIPHKQGVQESSYGLRGLQERLELVGGQLQVESKPGEGTQLLATVPRDGYSHASLPQADVLTGWR